nr:unnamed protein product [Naegleria fowleri]
MNHKHHGSNVNAPCQNLDDFEQDFKHYLFSSSNSSSTSSSMSSHLESVSTSLSPPTHQLPTVTCHPSTSSTTTTTFDSCPSACNHDSSSMTTTPFTTTSPPVPSSFSPITGRPLFPRLRHTGKTKCANCQSESTPMWRKRLMGEILCNKCGLYLVRHGKTRPLDLSNSSHSSSPSGEDSKINSSKKQRQVKKKSKKSNNRGQKRKNNSCQETCHDEDLITIVSKKEKTQSKIHESIDQNELNCKKLRTHHSLTCASKSTTTNLHVMDSIAPNVSPHSHCACGHSNEEKVPYTETSSMGRIISVLTQPPQPLQVLSNSVTMATTNAHSLWGNPNNCYSSQLISPMYHPHCGMLPSPNSKMLFMNELPNVNPNSINNIGSNHSIFSAPHVLVSNPNGPMMVHTPLNLRKTEISTPFVNS